MGIVNENACIKSSEYSKIRPNQHLVMKVAPDHAAFIQDNFGLEKANDDLDINEELVDEIEVVISPSSRLLGRKLNYFKKVAYEELVLLGMWRKGAKFRTSLAKQSFKIGDVLLLGIRDPRRRCYCKMNYLGLMPIQSRDISTLPSRSRFLKALFSSPVQFYLLRLMLLM